MLSRTSILALIPALALASVPVGDAAAAPRTVLAELFGDASCTECVTARTSLEQLETAVAESTVVWLEYHAGLLGNADTAARAGYYGDPARPTAVFDGTLTHTGGPGSAAVYQAHYDTRRADPADLAIGGLFFFEAETSQGTGVLTVEADPTATIPAPEDVWVRAVLYERLVQQCCGTGNQDVWARVARKVLPATPLTADQPGEVQTFELNFLLDPSWNTTQLGAVVFVQRDTDRSVLNARDARVSGVLEPLPVSFFDDTRVNLFQNAPNPTRNRTQIDFFLPEADDASLRILDARGRVVRVLTDGPRTQGFHPFLWDGMDHLGRPVTAGMYVYVLETSTDRIARRLVILR